MKLLQIVGARPQFVKYSPVSRALKALNATLSEPIENVLVHSGQHYDYNMSKVFFDELQIEEPAHHLNVGSGSHGAQTAAVLRKAEEVIKLEKPDAVIVYGDTNTTLAGALAAAKIPVPLVHIEAGLRSFNRAMPEEINRIAADRAATMLLCPSTTATKHLASEGFENIVLSGALVPLGSTLESLHATFSIDVPIVLNVGDLMYDVLLYSISIAEKRSDVLTRLRLQPKEYTLLTLHRAENTDVPDRLASMLAFALKASAGRQILFPVHPRTRKTIDSLGIRLDGRFVAVDPLGYYDLLVALKHSSMALTDSGGLQKEAFWLETPCVTLREETEWVETVESGWNTLYRNFSGSHDLTAPRVKPYGDGGAAERIVRILHSAFSPRL
jgi:UDP-N-acetylglucosamine 2-epimerase